ncbi:prolactin-releasing peptide receptor-like [Schistocerca piceifrons]|uniref:prolactin-releasing peptide receptor-like n=1 Tax=Schistocerca piceifrons TaxID=274613 RepID=UPI001F5FE9C6|nr:prolactin-releasing peptide receptor-like [Schistocerca piceifrons]
MTEGYGAIEVPVAANTSWTTNSSESPAFLEYDIGNDIIYNDAVQALFCVVYTTIFVLGLAGNALVVAVVARNRAMHTVTNVFIGNLALSDVLLCALCVPFTPLYTFLGSWVFGGALCRAVVLAQGTSVYTSTLTLTSIAVDRFFVIVHPFRPRMRLSTCAWSLAGIWLFSALATLPYGLYTVLRAEHGYYYCEESWPSERARLAYGAVTAAAQFALPFAVSAFCYVRVSLRLGRRARHKPGCRSARRDDADRERKRRTNRMLVAMVAIFGLSWMPLTVLNLANDVFTSFGTWRYFNLCFFLVHALAMSSTCYNPFLYAWMNDNFRKEFRRVLPCFGLDTGGGNARGAPRISCAPSGRTQDSLLPTTSTTQPLAASACLTRLPSPAEVKEDNATRCASYSVPAEEVHLQVKDELKFEQDGRHLLTGVLSDTL